MAAKSTPSRRSPAALRRARERIAALEERVRLLEARSEVLRAAGIGTWDLDLTRDRAVWDGPVEALLGLDEHRPESLTSRLERIRPPDRERARQTVLAAFRRGRAFEVEVPVRTSGGTRIVQSRGRVLPGPDGSPARATGLYWDVTEQRRTEQRARELADHDALTGLANRRFFEEQVEIALRRADREASLVGVLCLDLDHFKQVNEGLGYRTGDALLCATAARLARRVRAGDPLGRLEWPEGTISRMDGDEFSLLLPGLAEPEQAARVARRLLHALAEPFRLEGQEVYVGASIGLALYPVDGRDAPTLLRNANSAMHAAKAGGRNDYRFFAESMNRLAHRRLQVEKAMRRALREEGLALHYQPLVDAKSRRIVAVEALVRLRDSQDNWFGPDEFIPIAEDTGLIVPLGEWVLRQACRQARAWEEAGRPLRLSVNLSSVQIARSGFQHQVAQVLRETGLDPQRLVLEITETAILRDRTLALEALDAICSLGVTVALDDFGTGYSSLTWLRQFPIGCLKIDKTFVRDVGLRPGDAQLTEGIARLARGLGLVVVAEGVETELQAERMTAFGCHTLQGFFFAHPMDAADLAALLAEGDVPLPLERR